MGGGRLLGVLLRKTTTWKCDCKLKIKGGGAPQILLLFNEQIQDVLPSRPIASVSPFLLLIRIVKKYNAALSLSDGNNSSVFCILHPASQEGKTWSECLVWLVFGLAQCCFNLTGGHILSAFPIILLLRACQPVPRESDGHCIATNHRWPWRRGWS